MPVPLPFRPGGTPHQALPLARYLPPLPEGIASGWLGGRLPPGAWLIDPFGASPLLPAEAARAGYRVLVASNNPVGRFLLELSASPPREADLTAALAELADARRGEERLEPHLRGLYTTSCAQCNRPVEAQAFLWERDAPAPYARQYRCPHCGDAGERPATSQDASRAARFSAGGPHRARALERIASPGDPQRAFAEEALEAYLPRALYAAITLINRLEGLLSGSGLDGPAGAARQRSLLALTLSALDQADSLWYHPVSRARPRQLSTPLRFRENNLWLALEEAAAQLASTSAPVPLVIWPELPPPGGGLSVFEGRLKDLQEQLQTSPAPPEFHAALGAVPRYNQAFWTLSALWAGWLWGREAIGPFRSVLRRRRYDWGWHTTALQSALSSLWQLLPPGAPLLGLLGEAETSFLIAALLAARGAGFELHGLALRPAASLAQLEWTRGAAPAGSGARLPAGEFKGRAAVAAQDHLLQRGEPCSFLALHTAALAGVVDDYALQDENFPQVQALLDETLSGQHGFFRFAAERQPEVSGWWHPDLRPEVEPLADRTEKEVVRYLLAHPGCSLGEIDASACQALPGLLTPSLELVERCLKSYGELNLDGSWQARAAEAPAARRADITAMRMDLMDLGARLGFTPRGEKPVEWLSPSGEIALAFYLQASAAAGQLLAHTATQPARSIVVLPGARASLLVYKLRHDPRLAQLAASGWRFLKFRHLRTLAGNPALNAGNLDEQLGLDPLTEDTEQMRLL